MASRKSDKKRDSGFNGSFDSSEDSPSRLQRIEEGNKSSEEETEQPDLNTDSKGSNQQSDPGNNSNPKVLAPVRMAAPKLTLDSYTGHPQNLVANRGPIEPHIASEWLKRVIKVGRSCGWTDHMLASSASLALVPGSPAHIWYQLHNRDDSLEDWDTFKVKLVEEFDPQDTPMERMTLLRVMKFKSGDMVQHYENMLNLNFARFSMSPGRSLSLLRHPNVVWIPGKQCRKRLWTL